VNVPQLAGAQAPVNDITAPILIEAVFALATMGRLLPTAELFEHVRNARVEALADKEPDRAALLQGSLRVLDAFEGFLQAVESADETRRAQAYPAPADPLGPAQANIPEEWRS
jgi:hypothetical protein